MKIGRMNLANTLDLPNDTFLKTYSSAELNNDCTLAIFLKNLFRSAYHEFIFTELGVE